MEKAGSQSEFAEHVVLLAVRECSFFAKKRYGSKSTVQSIPHRPADAKYI